MKDLIISAVSEYDFESIRPWVNSIEMSGFTGRKAMVVFNVTDAMIKELEDHGFEVFKANDGRNVSDTGTWVGEYIGHRVPTYRHLMNWIVLDQKINLDDIGWVISTDCTDVVFQTNPSDFLKQHSEREDLEYHATKTYIIAGQEGLLYKDEAWGNDNMMQCYGPMVHSMMKDKRIYNAGTMAGSPKAFRDFSLEVWLKINLINNPVPDQAGVNVTLASEAWSDITYGYSHDNPWACQCGTTVDPTKIEGFRPHLLCNEPVMKDGVVVTAQNSFNWPVGTPYVMVHQYNRVPEWNTIIKEKYGKK